MSEYTEDEPNCLSAEELTRVADDPPPGLALVMSCTVPKGSKAKFYTDLAKLPRSVALEAMSDADVPGWIMERGEQAHGLRVDVDADSIPLGIVYAVWSGVGTAVIVLIGWVVFRETLDAIKLAGIGLIIIGVVMLNGSGAEG